MDTFVWALVATLVASILGGIYAVKKGGITASGYTSRRDLALQTGAVIGFVIGIGAGAWCIVTAILGAVGALLFAIFLFNRATS